MTHHHHHHPKTTTTTKPTGQQEDWENVAVIVVAILIVIVLVTMCVFDRIKRFIKARCYSKLRNEDDGEDNEVTIDLDKDGNHALISEGDLIWLYISHALQAFGDRLWQFAVPILFMLVWDSTLLPTAIFQFALCTSTFLLTAPMGNWIDRTDRLVVFKNAVVGQNVCIIINCLLVWMLAYLVIPDCENTFSYPCGSSTTSSPANNITTSLGKNEITYFQGSIFMLVVTTAIAAQLGGTAATISIEKDWIVRIANNNRTLLTRYNTILRRIDLLCKLLAPFTFGVYLSLFWSRSNLERVCACLLLLAAFNFVGLFPEYLSMRKIYYKTKELQHKPEPEGKKENVFVGMVSGWRRYVSHPMFFASFGYCFLYFSVLDNGSLMTAYLMYSNVHEGLLGASRGGGALFGLLGTLLFQLIYPRCLSVRSTGRITVWLFFLVIMPAGLVLFSNYANDVDASTPAYVMLLCVCLARVWLWAFDLAHTQAMQMAIAEQEVGILYTCQTGVYQLFWMILYILGMIFSDPDHFPILALLSVLSVFTAAVIWSAWSCCGLCSNRFDMTVEQIAETFKEQKKKHDDEESKNQPSEGEADEDESDEGKLDESKALDDAEVELQNVAAKLADSDGEGESTLKSELSAAEREAMEQIVQAAINDSTEDDDYSPS